MSSIPHVEDNNEQAVKIEDKDAHQGPPPTLMATKASTKTEKASFKDDTLPSSDDEGSLSDQEEDASQSSEMEVDQENKEKQTEEIDNESGEEDKMSQDEDSEPMVQGPVETPQKDSADSKPEPSAPPRHIKSAHRSRVATTTKQPVFDKEPEAAPEAAPEPEPFNSSKTTETKGPKYDRLIRSGVSYYKVSRSDIHRDYYLPLDITPAEEKDLQGSLTSTPWKKIFKETFPIKGIVVIMAQVRIKNSDGDWILQEEQKPHWYVTFKQHPEVLRPIPSAQIRYVLKLIAQSKYKTSSLIGDLKQDVGQTEQDHLATKINPKDQAGWEIVENDDLPEGVRRPGKASKSGKTNVKGGSQPSSSSTANTQNGEDQTEGEQAPSNDTAKNNNSPQDSKDAKPKRGRASDQRPSKKTKVEATEVDTASGVELSSNSEFTFSCTLPPQYTFRGDPDNTFTAVRRT